MKQVLKIIYTAYTFLETSGCSLHHGRESFEHRITMYAEGPLRGKTRLYANLSSLLAIRRSSQPVQCVFGQCVELIDSFWPQQVAPCDMRWDRNFKGSD